MQVFQRIGRAPLTLVLPAMAVLLVVFGAPTVQLFLESLNAPNFSIQNYSSFLGGVCQHSGLAPDPGDQCDSDGHLLVGRVSHGIPDLDSV